MVHLHIFLEGKKRYDMLYKFISNKIIYIISLKYL